MRIMVTGGAGFIGSAVIRHLIQKTTHDVLNVDCLTYAGSLSTLEAEANSPRYRFIKASITDKAAISAAMTEWQPDAVIHLAAESHVDRSIDGPAAFIDTNVVGTSVLLEASQAHFERLPAARRGAFRFHHVSTDEVFGTLGSTGRFTEASSYDPRSPYSASKAASDHLVRAWHHTYGLPVVITNCSNNYGPYQFPEKLIPLMILNGLSAQPLPLYGRGDQVRDWIHVEDHVEALLTVLTRGRVGETYLIGGESERTNHAVVEEICRLLDELSPLAGVPDRRELIRFVADRPGHDQRYAVDCQKIKSELGWAPRRSFSKGLGETVAWYVAHRDWHTQAIRGAGYELTRLGLRSA